MANYVFYTCLKAPSQTYTFYVRMHQSGSNQEGFVFACDRREWRSDGRGDDMTRMSFVALEQLRLLIANHWCSIFRTKHRLSWQMENNKGPLRELRSYSGQAWFFQALFLSNNSWGGVLIKQWTQFIFFMCLSLNKQWTFNKNHIDITWNILKSNETPIKGPDRNVN